MKNNRKYSLISGRLLLRFVLSEALLLLVPVGGFFLSEVLFSMYVWQPGDALYVFGKILQALSPIIIFCFFSVGTLILMYRTIKKPLSYLDDVVEAAKKLSDPSCEAIELPPQLAEIEDELNLIKMQSLRNSQLATDAVQRKNDLIMYLAHDLKTPLTSVIGYLTLLRDEDEISEELRQKYLSISLEKAERLEDLINEFFEIARFNLSHITLEYSRVSLTRLLEQLAFEFKPFLDEKSLTCKLDVPPDLMIRCDVDKLQRVFDNILKNAVNYSFEGGEIGIAVRQVGKNYSIRFMNSGNTIPEEKLGRIFEQFYRLDAARSSKSGGAGLGLAIAKEIVTLHGGTITAKSEDEKVEFEVTLPVS